MATAMLPPGGIEAYNNANRDAEIISGAATLIILPTIFVGLRLLSRWMSRASLWWDDYTLILALFFSWGPNILSLVGLHHGFGKHLLTILTFTPDRITAFFKYLYSFEICYVFAMVAVKFSIILFQYRIFPVIQYRRFLIFWGVFTALLGMASIIVCIFQCVPIHGFWDNLAGTLPGAKCVNVNKFLLIAGGINAGTDFIVLAMPIPLLWKLRTGKLQKLILTGIFTVGLVVCAVSVVRLNLLSSFDRSDITWDYVPTAIWTAAEPSIGIISACLPSLRPLFAKLVWGRSYRPKMGSRSSRGYSGGRGGGQKGFRSGSFHKMHDGTGMSSEEPINVEPWRHKAQIRAGRESEDWGSEEYDIGGYGTGEGKGEHTPKTGIRVRTTVTVTEKVDWLDDLF